MTEEERKADKIKSEMIEDIYDILFKPNFRNEAMKRFKKRWWHKEILVDFTQGEEKYILMGKKYKLILKNV